MAQDRCTLHAPDGAVLARGHVVAAGPGALQVQVVLVSGAEVEAGDQLAVQTFNPLRGRALYDAEVEGVDGPLVDLAVELVRAVQERRAVRVTTDLAHVFTVLRREDDVRPLHPAVPVTVLEVSAHGLRFWSPSPFEVGDVLTSGLGGDLPKVPLLRVVRRIEGDAGPGFAAQYAGTFVGASEKDTDVLFRFVNDEQRRQVHAMRQLS